MCIRDRALYNVVDSIFVSHVSESALTAVSLAFSLQNVMIAVGAVSYTHLGGVCRRAPADETEPHGSALPQGGDSPGGQRLPELLSAGEVLRLSLIHISFGYMPAGVVLMTICAPLWTASS